MAKTVALGDLEREAAELWRSLPRGAVVWLSGELGAGKTALAQAITRAARATTARSPTFALIHEYACPEGVIAHVDCYRLRDPDEARDLDLAELAGRSRLTIIEWPERAGRHAPPPHAHLRLSHDAAPDQRQLEQVS